MSQPVKLSDALIVEARAAGNAMERSIAGQVEFWARLGKAVEGLLTGQQMRAIGGKEDAQELLRRLDEVDTPQGRNRVMDFLQSEPYPHYEACPEDKGLLIRIEENGRRTTGRFVNREFVVVKDKARDHNKRRKLAA